MSKDTFYDEDNEIIDFILEEDEKDIKNWAKFFGFKQGDEEGNKKTFKTQSRKYHPDLHPDDPNAEKQFKKLNTAHEYMKNPEKVVSGNNGSETEDHDSRFDKGSGYYSKYGKNWSNYTKDMDSFKNLKKENLKRKKKLDKKIDFNKGKFRDDYLRKNKIMNNAAFIGSLGSAVAGRKLMNKSDFYKSKLKIDIKQREKEYNKYVNRCKEKNKKPLSIEEWTKKKIKDYKIAGNVANLGSVGITFANLGRNLKDVYDFSKYKNSQEKFVNQANYMNNNPNYNFNEDYYQGYISAMNDFED